eukprot:PhM_4_TR16603/c0_g2_i1/m.5540
MDLLSECIRRRLRAEDASCEISSSNNNNKSPFAPRVSAWCDENNNNNPLLHDALQNHIYISHPFHAVIVPVSAESTELTSSVRVLGAIIDVFDDKHVEASPPPPPSRIMLGIVDSAGEVVFEILSRPATK